MRTTGDLRAGIEGVQGNIVGTSSLNCVYGECNGLVDANQPTVSLSWQRVDRPLHSSLLLLLLQPGIEQLFGMISTSVNHNKTHFRTCSLTQYTQTHSQHSH